MTPNQFGSDVDYAEYFHGRSEHVPQLAHLLRVPEYLTPAVIVNRDPGDEDDGEGAAS